MSKKDLAVKEDHLPVTAIDYGEYAGIGGNDIGSEGLAIPFINVLQALSPQVTEQTVPGARSGQFFNTVTQELTDGNEGLIIQPIYEEYVFVEWTPREKGGGFIAVHRADDDLVKETLHEDRRDDKGKLLTADGNSLVETFQVYVRLLTSDGKDGLGFGVVSFTSTKIKSYRAWKTSRDTIRGVSRENTPVFAHRAKLTTLLSKNKNNQSFYVTVISPFAADERGTPNWRLSMIDPKTEGHLLKEAFEFRKVIESGRAKAAYETAAPETETGTDKEVPF